MKSKTLTACVASTLLATGSLFAAPTVAVYDLDKALSENGTSKVNPLDLASQFGATQLPLTHFDITQSLKAVAGDPDVPAVVLDIDGANISLAQAQEIRRLLLKVREAGKDVWIYSEYLTPTSLLLGSAANHFTLMPAGNVMLKGLYSERMYFKGLLDKIGARMEVVHIGDFKSAGETYYRSAPSEYALKQENALFDSLYKQLLNSVSESRGVSSEKMEEIIDMGLISPKQALEFKLVDHLKYRTDFINEIRAKYDKETVFSKSYALPDVNGPEIKGFFDLMKVLMNSSKDKESHEPYIAVVPLEGNITDKSIAEARLQILKAARNEHCEALVLRVNSPGGSALASDVLWEATAEFKATDRPFVVSMGSVAASGGYYISAAADHIFAEAGTVTGSIGVVGMKPVFGEALEKFGINVHSNQRGKNAGMLSSTRSYTPEEREIVRQSMLEVYGEFKQRILDGRGDKLKGDLEKLAGGRIYSGTDALAVGLVDEIGGLQMAINHAKTLAEAEDAKAKLLPKPKGAFDGMFAQPDKDKHEFIQANYDSASVIDFRSTIITNELMQILSPSMQQQLEQFCSQLKSIQKNEIQLLAPAMPGL